MDCDQDVQSELLAMTGASNSAIYANRVTSKYTTIIKQQKM